jgi:uncharacterized protein (TIGR02145 family)
MKKYFSYVVALVFLAIATSSCKKETPTPELTSVADIDGNTYPVVKICGKFWMAENLKTTRYNDGAAIVTNLTNAQWGAATGGAFAIYDADAANNATYGKLYNWFAASSGKLAPTGWHVATEAEWNELVTCLEGSGVAGGKMKAVSTLWDAPNAGAGNSSGFGGLPAGYRGTSGNYALKGRSAYFWGSDQRNTTQGEYLLLNADFASTAVNGATKQFGYSVRCVKD